MPSTKPGLRIRWSAKHMDYQVETTGGDTTAGPNLQWLIGWLRVVRLEVDDLRQKWGKPTGREYPHDSLRQELFDRGYDPETLRVTVQRRAGCMTAAERDARRAG